MKKLILTVFVALNLFTSNAQQLGVVNISPKETEIPVDFWYVIDGKDFVNQMFYYNTTEKTKEVLKNMLAGYGQSSETPFGTDKEGDNYWIITHPSGNIVYLYYSVDEDGYSMIISVTK
jgi:hypothetical protein